MKEVLPQRWKPRDQASFKDVNYAKAEIWHGEENSCYALISYRRSGKRPSIFINLPAVGVTYGCHGENFRSVMLALISTNLASFVQWGGATAGIESPGLVIPHNFQRNREIRLRFRPTKLLSYNLAINHKRPQGACIANTLLCGYSVDSESPLSIYILCECQITQVKAPISLYNRI